MVRHKYEGVWILLPELSFYQEGFPPVALPFNLRRDAFGDNFCP